MCSPSLIVGGISLVATGFQMRAASQNQQAMLDYENKKTRMVQENALKARIADERALAQKTQQLQERTALELKLDRQREDVQFAAAKVASQRAGVGEQGLGELMTTMSLQAAENAAVRMRNLSWEEQQVMRAFDKIGANYESRLNQRYLPAISGASWGDLLGGVASAAGSYFSTPQSFDELKNPFSSADD